MYTNTHTHTQSLIYSIWYKGHVQTDTLRAHTYNKVCQIVTVQYLLTNTHHTPLNIHEDTPDVLGVFL